MRDRDPAGADTAPGAYRFERLRRDHQPDLLELAEAFRADGDPLYDDFLASPEAFFERVDRFERGQDLPADRVPMSQFLLFDADRLVAASRLRRALIPALHLDGGHIGYEVRPGDRRRGHGAEILRRTLDEARAIGLDRVLLTAADWNAASITLIESAGGEPDGERISPRTGDRMRRFWIPL